LYSLPENVSDSEEECDEAAEDLETINYSYAPHDDEQIKLKLPEADQWPETDKLQRQG
jgi:hypothetical protein